MGINFLQLQKRIFAILSAVLMAGQGKALAANSLKEIIPSTELFQESKIKQMAMDQSMDLLLQQLSEHRDPSSFVSFFGDKLSEEARWSAELLLLATESEKGPQFSREGDSLVIREEGSDFRIKVVDPDLMQFRMNGDLVVIDSNKDLESQIDLLFLRADMREKYKNGHSLWMNLLVPQAEAFVGILVREGLALAASVLVEKGGAKALKAMSPAAKKSLLKSALALAKKVGAAPFKAAAKGVKSLASNQWVKENLRGALWGAGFNEVFLATKLQACQLGYNMGEKYLKTGTCAAYVAANPDAEEKPGSTSNKSSRKSFKSSFKSTAKASTQKESTHWLKKNGKAKSKSEIASAVPKKKKAEDENLAPIALKCNYEARPPQAEVSLMRPNTEELVFQTVTFNPTNGALIESQAGGVDPRKPLNVRDLAHLNSLPPMVASVCMNSKPTSSPAATPAVSTPAASASHSDVTSVDEKSALGTK